MVSESEKKYPRRDEMEVKKMIALGLALGQYVGEPCRVCGEAITAESFKDGLVFAGYSEDSRSRAAHQSCWDKRLPKDRWAFPVDASRPEEAG
jgi:hypothetical protein